MKPHAVRVYAIEITYPDGSSEPGWYPPRWNEPEFLATLTKKQRRQLPQMKREFRWPHERLFLAASGAAGRAMLLRAYGAQAQVRGSDQVTWHVHPSKEPSPWPFPPPPPAEEDMAAELARREAAREWMHDNAGMYLSDTAQAAADAARFRDR